VGQGDSSLVLWSPVTVAELLVALQVQFVVMALVVLDIPELAQVSLLQGQLDHRQMLHDLCESQGLQIMLIHYSNYLLH
jgi:hypothetical protein